VSAVIVLCKRVEFPTGHMAKEQKMVDPVSMGPAKLVVGGPAKVRISKADVINPSQTQTDHAPSLPHLLEVVSKLESRQAPVDYAKIAQIRQAIALGQYMPDPVKIADAMLGFGGKATA
jgi:flagellar biosynthesis anti-sigma factor FlgM